MNTRSELAGFTLIELVVIMLIVGILAAFAVPRLNLTAFRETGFLQQSTAAIRYAQKQAIAAGCNVQVNITSGGCNLNWSGCAGNVALRNPANNDTDFCSDSTPEGAVSNGNFLFDNIGRPVPNASRNITIGSSTITVEAETGYVH